MLRTALRPRWLALLVLVLVLATAFAALGSWQLDRARRSDPAPSGAQGPPVPIDDVAAPAEQLAADALAGPVVAVGTYDPARALVVVDRRLGGRLGAWVVAPLVVGPGSAAEGQGGDATTARLAVVLGWTPDTDPAGAAAAVVADLPAGPTRVVGRLQISQEPREPEPGLLPAQVTSLSSADLVNDWGPPVYSGFLLAQEAPRGLEAVPVPQTPDGIELLNLSYAVQWWVFAAFAVFLWWRVVRDAHQDAARDIGGDVAVGDPEAEAATRTVPGDTGGSNGVPALRSEHA